MTRPIRTWRRAAEILGVSEETLKRHRIRFGDRTRVPHWRTPEAVHDWYERLIAPPELPAAPEPRRRPTQTRDVGKAVDQAALRAEILGD